VSRRSCAAASIACLALCAAGGASAGPYTERGYAPSEALAWATAVDGFDRGPLDAANPSGGDASFGAPEYALGPPTNDVYDVFSLGDGGWITFYVAGGIHDGPGDDFAVFENGFYAPGGLYGELAFVEVSTNGVDFVRFPATSLRAAPVAGGGTIDPTDYHNLAGRQPLNQGTGFDLAELGLSSVSYLRLVDVIGNGATHDAAGRPVYDPYPTAYPSGGFDVDAVAVPEPGFSSALAAGWVSVSGLALRRRPCAPRR
jgi:hypothetical protein